jgi:AcrR family transcriptional regulator
VKNTKSGRVRNGTSQPIRPERPDRRVRRTKRSLHDALISLAREKPYDAIAVKEILDRADVGRSTFYTHFDGKDALLDSGIHQILSGAAHPRRSTDPLERVVAFSLPALEQIDAHRREGAAMTSRSRGVMHKRLEDVLAGLIVDDVAALAVRRGNLPGVPAGLLARHIAATFVLVLNWWVECEPALSPAVVDARFRALVLPALTAS